MTKLNMNIFNLSKGKTVQLICRYLLYIGIYDNSNILYRNLMVAIFTFYERH